MVELHEQTENSYSKIPPFHISHTAAAAAATATIIGKLQRLPVHLCVCNVTRIEAFLHESKQTQFG